MRGTTVTGAAGGPGRSSSAARTPPENRPALLTPVYSAIAIAAVLALILRGYLLVRSGLLSVTQYDDGPYFGSAVRLVHGMLPYRDYAFVQPPGITLLMSPVAALTYLTGTAWGLAIGRIATVLASTAAVVLGGLLVRHRGWLAVVVTCGILAIYPPGAAAAHTVLLEPWLVLACLAGAVVVFDGDRLAGKTSRLAWGGVLFGLGGAVKVWAIAPALVVFVLCLPSLRRAGIFAAGVAAGFLVPALPFAIAAPRQFYDSVVVAQLARVGFRVPVRDRLHDMIGLLPGQVWPDAAILAAAVAVAAAVVLSQAANWLIDRSPPPVLEWFATLTAGLVVAMFLWSTFFATHYAAFLMPFLALALALPIARLAANLRPTGGRGRTTRWQGPVAGALICVALVAAGVVEAQPGAGLLPVPVRTTAIERVIPPGACVVTDSASYLLLANRFVSDVPGCPAMVDSLGTDLALSGGRRPNSGAAGVPAVQAAWRYAFRHAQYVVLTYRGTLQCGRSPHPCGRIAWTPQLLAYFHASFRAVRHAFHFTVYARRGLAAHAPAALPR